MILAGHNKSLELYIVILITEQIYAYVIRTFPPVTSDDSKVFNDDLVEIAGQPLVPQAILPAELYVGPPSHPVFDAPRPPSLQGPNATPSFTGAYPKNYPPTMR